ncbi:hypothetical protein A176_006874 [Myxococcus hansupus]|uniref:Uncharacterized protein n=1 Tax=Pseudomyxococcus hansupus TaxID=1297742 RepID=A0A0H4XNK3_9BACT|nr:hypothetical protein [Myxococcus hansupus]AKQ69962.1 hypothetical protein A176_006874 [Myxococcus hansupus]
MSHIDELGEETTFEEVSRRFAGASWLASFLETEELNDPETNGIVVPRIVSGSLRFDDTLESGSGPWAVIVVGDLETRGDLVCTTDDYLTSTLIVTGDVRARNVRFAASARVGIEGDLVVGGGLGIVSGTWGDGGAVLWARSCEAALVLLDDNTSISADRCRRTLVCGSTSWREFTPDIHGHETFEALFEPAAFDARGNLDPARAMALANEGRSALRPDVENRLRGSKGLAPREALTWLASAPECRELLERGDDAAMKALSEQLAQRGHTVSIESLTRSVRALRGARLDSHVTGS